MKKILFISMLLMISFLPARLRNWKSYTNTSHVYDMVQIDNNFYLATWGGLLEYDTSSNLFTKTLTSVDGLVDHHTRCLTYNENSNLLYIGTKYGGVSRMKNDQFLMPITPKIGLLSNFVKKIILRDNQIFIATDKGLSIFIDDATTTFPILDTNINDEDGLLNKDISAMVVSENWLFCGSEVGLSYVEIDSLHYSNAWKYLSTDNSFLLSNDVTSLSINNDKNKLSVATTNGVSIFTLPELEEYQSISHEDLQNASSSIYPIFWDDSDNLWLSYGKWDEDAMMIEGEANHSLSCISNITSQTFDLKHYEISEFGADRVFSFHSFDGQIFYSSWGQGFYKKENDSWQQIKPNCIIANFIQDLKMDKNNKLWIANGHRSAEYNSKGTKGISAFDGETWTNYKAENSSLRSNNIITIEVDEANQKWFGAWTSPEGSEWKAGISIFDEENDTWQAINTIGENALLNYIVADIDYVSSDEIWVATFDGGIQKYNIDQELLASSECFYDETDKVVKIEPYQDYCFIGTWFEGLEFWQNENFPNVNNSEFWHQVNANELKNGKIHDIIVRETQFDSEIWVASVSGVFMFNGDSWYKYGAIQKKQILINSSWQPTDIEQPEYSTPEFWYIEGQERLFGSVTTFPTAFYVDPFNRLWIGCKDNGFTIYSPEEDTYENYSPTNSPLLSEAITSFEYDPYKGIMYIGTENGLNSVEIGFTDAYNSQKKLSSSIVYPNPFYPDRGFLLKIIDKKSGAMPKGNTTCTIYDLNGRIVNELEKDEFQEFTWNGKNKAGRDCSSAIYLYIISTADGQISRGKIVLIH